MWALCWLSKSIFMIELNSTVKYPKYMFNIEVNAGVVQFCGEKPISSDRALAVGEVQPAAIV